MGDAGRGRGGRLPGQRVVEGGPQAVEVGAGVGVARRVVLLRRGVLRRPHPPQRRPGARVPGVPEFHQSEVHQHGLPVRADDDVLRLNVPVDDPLAVAIGQRVQQLAGPLQHLILRQRPSGGDEVRQTLPLDQVHHQIGVAAFLKEVGHPHQVGVVQAGQGERFLAELPAQVGQGLGVQTGLGDHLLDGDGDLQPGVPGPVDGAHSAPAQERLEVVAVLQNPTGTG
jgi:hypothetical protein